MKIVTAFAPATVANVAVGFDILGFAFKGIGDQVTLKRVEKPEIIITEISVAHNQLEDSEFKDLPRQAEKNTATVGILQMISDFHLNFGFEISIRKGIPLGSGMGGSAASAVAGVLAASRFLPSPIDKETLLSYALIGEKVATGDAHADNVAPCIWGGLILAQSIDPPHFIPLPFPEQVVCVLVHPNLRVDTRSARGILSKTLSLKDHIRQSANLGGFVAGCFKNDLQILKRSFEDNLIEPQRAHLVPGFYSAKTAALERGALGCSLSGSGPSLFAWAENQIKADDIRNGMVSALAKAGLKSDAWIAHICPDGARVLHHE